MDRLLWSRVHDLQFRCTAPPIDYFRTHVAQLEEALLVRWRQLTPIWPSEPN